MGWLLGRTKLLCIFTAPAASGPRVFLPAPYVEPPPEDIKVIDARRLPPQQQAHDEVSIAAALPTA